MTLTIGAQLKSARRTGVPGTDKPSDHNGAYVPEVAKP